MVELRRFDDRRTCHRGAGDRVDVCVGDLSATGDWPLQLDGDPDGGEFAIVDAHGHERTRIESKTGKAPMVPAPRVGHMLNSHLAWRRIGCLLCFPRS